VAGELMLVPITAALTNRSIRVSTELELQDQVGSLLSKSGIAYEREVRLSGKDRIDFLVGTIGLELKIDGTLANLTRQLDRYAASERISELLVVSTRLTLCRVPTELRGKPVHTICVGGL
jgi:hypothetical protein